MVAAVGTRGERRAGGKGKKRKGKNNNDFVLILGGCRSKRENGKSLI